MQAEADVEITSQDIKNNLIDQIKQKKEEQRNAVQEQKTNEVHVRQPSGDSESLGGRGEEEEEADYSEQKAKGKGFKYKLGDDYFDIDDRALFQIKADGKTIDLSFGELRDAAAGGIAVRNRMRSLAEDKKKLLNPYKGFSKNAEQDPMLALKKVFNVIKQVDPDADFKKFLAGLGKQAQNLSKMSPSERKAYELEKELDETRENLSESERIAKIQERKQELIGEGLSEDKIFEYGQGILQDPTLASTVRNEEDLFDRIEDLADEVSRQQAVLSALHKVDSSIKGNDPLVFELSQILDKNPDFDEEDLEEIVSGVLRGVKKSTASQVLSKRQRSKAAKGYGHRVVDHSKLSTKESLMQQILEKKQQKKTMR